MQEMVLLCTVKNAAEALMVKALLDDTKIEHRTETVTPNTYGYFSDPSYGFGVPMGPVSFYVPEDKYSEAKKLLEAVS